MTPVLDCTTEAARATAVARAAEAIQRGELVVLPTDTVYGIGTDAFDVDAVAAVLAAKGRGREMPPPVLVPNPRTVDGLATAVPAYARVLMKAFWPGPLTLVLRAQTSLMWDLGDTNGTVALRMPRDDTALALLDLIGPMAVTSANVTGQPAATTVTEAAVQLGSAVGVYLDAGPSTGAVASTILDCTKESPVVLRAGAVSDEQLRDVLGDVPLHDPSEPVAADDQQAPVEPVEPVEQVEPPSGEPPSVEQVEPPSGEPPSVEQVEPPSGEPPEPGA